MSHNRSRLEFLGLLSQVQKRLEVRPDPTSFLEAFATLLDSLVGPADKGGCGWRANDIHLFGFAQGASAALEGALFWSRMTVGFNRFDDETRKLGSIVSVCGELLSHPTTTKSFQTPVLHFHRLGISSSKSKSTAASLQRIFSHVESVAADSGRANAAMPQGESEWYPILKFWSRLLRIRASWEMEAGLFSLKT